MGVDVRELMMYELMYENSYAGVDVRELMRYENLHAGVEVREST